MSRHRSTPPPPPLIPMDPPGISGAVAIREHRLGVRETQHSLPPGGSRRRTPRNTFLCIVLLAVIFICGLHIETSELQQYLTTSVELKNGDIDVKYSKAVGSYTPKEQELFGSAPPLDTNIVYDDVGYYNFSCPHLKIKFLGSPGGERSRLARDFSVNSGAMSFIQKAIDSGSLDGRKILLLGDSLSLQTFTSIACLAGHRLIKFRKGWGDMNKHIQLKAPLLDVYYSHESGQVIETSFPNSGLEQPSWIEACQKREKFSFYFHESLGKLEEIVLDTEDFIVMSKTNHGVTFPPENKKRILELVNCMSDATKKGTANPDWPHIAYGVQDMPHWDSPRNAYSKKLFEENRTCVANASEHNGVVKDIERDIEELGGVLPIVMTDTSKKVVNQGHLHFGSGDCLHWLQPGVPDVKAKEVFEWLLNDIHDDIKIDSVSPDNVQGEMSCPVDPLLLKDSGAALQEGRKPVIVFAEPRTGSTLFNLFLNSIEKNSNTTDMFCLESLFSNTEPDIFKLLAVGRKMMRICQGGPLGSEMLTSSEWRQKFQDAVDQSQYKNLSLITQIMEENIWTKNFLDVFNKRLEAPTELLRKLKGVPSVSARSFFAFKMFRFHFNLHLRMNIKTFLKSVFQVWDKGEPIFIVVWRRRMIESYVSGLIAESKNVYMNIESNEHDVSEINRSDLEKFVEVTRAYYKEVRDTFLELGLHFEVIEYDRDLSNEQKQSETRRRLHGILGIPESEVSTEEWVQAYKGLKKQSQVPVHSQILNWEEVVEWGFGGDVDDWEDLFSPEAL